LERADLQRNKYKQKFATQFEQLDEDTFWEHDTKVEEKPCYMH